MKNADYLIKHGWKCWYKTKNPVFRSDKWEDPETGDLHTQSTAMEIQRRRVWAIKMKGMKI